jgi:hypothetical protein
VAAPPKQQPLPVLAAEALVVADEGQPGAVASAAVTAAVPLEAQQEAFEPLGFATGAQQPLAREACLTELVSPEQVSGQAGSAAVARKPPAVPVPAAVTVPSVTAVHTAASPELQASGQAPPLAVTAEADPWQRSPSLADAVVTDLSESPDRSSAAATAPPEQAVRSH